MWSHDKTSGLWGETAQHQTDTSKRCGSDEGGKQGVRPPAAVAANAEGADAGDTSCEVPESPLLAFSLYKVVVAGDQSFPCLGSTPTIGSTSTIRVIPSTVLWPVSRQGPASNTSQLQATSHNLLFEPQR